MRNDLRNQRVFLVSEPKPAVPVEPPDVHEPVFVERDRVLLPARDLGDVFRFEGSYEDWVMGLVLGWER